MSALENKTPKKRSPNGVLSPTFRSVAAMAGWDEEALLLASLIVDDTPVRESRHKKRAVANHLKSPPTTNSNRKRRSKRLSPGTVPAVVLCLDDDDDDDAPKKAPGDFDDKEKKVKGERVSEEKETGKGLPCMDKLREELSCAICLEICFEPSTTLCGHSFCMKCLKCAADKCGKRCPKCRQLISNGRSCTVNTVLWNTIQLLFPEEVEARKNAAAATSRSSSSSDSKKKIKGNTRTETNRSTRPSSFVSATQVSREMERDSVTRRSERRQSQSDDAALALRLQREEFMGGFQVMAEQPRQTLDAARANLRAMISRPYRIRTRVARY